MTMIEYELGHRHGHKHRNEHGHGHEHEHASGHEHEHEHKYEHQHEQIKSLRYWPTLSATDLSCPTKLSPILAYNIQRRMYH